MKKVSNNPKRGATGSSKSGGFKSGGFKSGGAKKTGGFKSGGFKSGGFKSGGFKSSQTGGDNKFAKPAGSFDEREKRDGEKRFDKPFSRDGERKSSKPYGERGEKKFAKPFSKDGGRKFDKPFSKDGEKKFDKPFNRDGEKKFDKPFNRDGEKKFAGVKGTKRRSERPDDIKRDFNADVEEADKIQDDYIIGVNPILEALSAGRAINRIMIAKARSSKQIQEIVKLAQEKKIVIQEVDPKKISEIADGQNHQGVVAYVSPYDYFDYDEMIKDLQTKEKAVVLVLDHITDMHNFGSILRTCDATRVDYVIIPNRRSVVINSIVSKTSAGAVEHMKVARVSSLANAIKDLQKIGFWAYGLDMDAKVRYNKADFAPKVVVVAGSEESGISASVAKCCDEILKIQMSGKVNSLNVSVATALVLYEIRNRD